LKVVSIAAVNCLGDVFDPETLKPAAGLLDETKTRIINTEEELYKSFDNKKNLFSGNTTIGVVVTNGRFSKAQANKIASTAHNGFACSIKPAHTQYDGDTIFVMATGEVEADINAAGSLASKTMAKAVLRAVTQAESAYGLKASRDL
jgi:L-aminopeptidase/D-esterase-like protein